MGDPVRVITWKADAADEVRVDPPEWLITNGLGGYACGTITGLMTRRYHGLLMAALPVPLGRMMMLDGISETVHLPDGHVVPLGANQVSSEGAVPDADHLTDFRLFLGIPMWRFSIGDVVIGRRLLMLHEQNTVLIHWRLFEGAESVELALRPFLHVRSSDARVSETGGRSYQVISQGERHEINVGPDLPTLKLLLRENCLRSRSTAEAARKSSTAGRRNAVTTVVAVCGVPAHSR